ncbi:hypothetical protein Bbelb_098960 [Branchiostoma belcheri]|nr:hypothetical protein Bbelb_098960 [Branchiostoma belcheri]
MDLPIGVYPAGRLPGSRRHSLSIGPPRASPTLGQAGLPARQLPGKVSVGRTPGFRGARAVVYSGGAISGQAARCLNGWIRPRYFYAGETFGSGHPLPGSGKRLEKVEKTDNIAGKLEDPLTGSGTRLERVERTDNMPGKLEKRREAVPLRFLASNRPQEAAGESRKEITCRGSKKSDVRPFRSTPAGKDTRCFQVEAVFQSAPLKLPFPQGRIKSSSRQRLGFIRVGELTEAKSPGGRNAPREE